ncbi:uncharacterized protein B0I36DRAFT_319849 [Microdochium trichocladiopsis]|uniref:Uncharacterized protein n=1 Tax=Microdochium trichocladiopsis TaxID=1682393 RepID=A0A9P8Y8K5_9PEZI|nr:uncharacterized protein B0I36DRAFT_319849 [Microdochium trichocladiopsis]KAH7032691.1 hypothetical protein B0I36DRAFT_319849 [Microdochium trichocladiopsis]
MPVRHGPCRIASQSPRADAPTFLVRSGVVSGVLPRRLPFFRAAASRWCATGRGAISSYLIVANRLFLEGSM